VKVEAIHGKSVYAVTSKPPKPSLDEQFVLLAAIIQPAV